MAIKKDQLKKKPRKATAALKVAWRLAAPKGRVAQKKTVVGQVTGTLGRGLGQLAGTKQRAAQKKTARETSSREQVTRGKFGGPTISGQKSRGKNSRQTHVAGTNRVKPQVQTSQATNALYSSLFGTITAESGTMSKLQGLNGTGIKPISSKLFDGSKYSTMVRKGVKPRNLESTAVQVPYATSSLSNILNTATHNDKTEGKPQRSRDRPTKNLKPNWLPIHGQQRKRGRLRRTPIRNYTLALSNSRKASNPVTANARSSTKSRKEVRNFGLIPEGQEPNFDWWEANKKTVPKQSEYLREPWPSSPTYKGASTSLFRESEGKKSKAYRVVSPLELSNADTDKPPMLYYTPTATSSSISKEKGVCTRGPGKPSPALEAAQVAVAAAATRDVHPSRTEAPPGMLNKFEAAKGRYRQGKRNWFRKPERNALHIVTAVTGANPPPKNALETYSAQTTTSAATGTRTSATTNTTTSPPKNTGWANRTMRKPAKKVPSRFTTLFKRKTHHAGSNADERQFSDNRAAIPILKQPAPLTRPAQANRPNLRTRTNALNTTNDRASTEFPGGISGTVKTDSPVAMSSSDDKDDITATPSYREDKPATTRPSNMRRPHHQSRIASNRFEEVHAIQSQPGRKNATRMTDPLIITPPPTMSQLRATVNPHRPSVPNPTINDNITDQSISLETREPLPHSTHPSGYAMPPARAKRPLTPPPIRRRATRSRRPVPIAKSSYKGRTVSRRPPPELQPSYMSEYESWRCPFTPEYQYVSPIIDIPSPGLTEMFDDMTYIPSPRTSEVFDDMRPAPLIAPAFTPMPPMSRPPPIPPLPRVPRAPVRRPTATRITQGSTNTARKPVPPPPRTRTNTAKKPMAHHVRKEQSQDTITSRIDEVQSYDTLDIPSEQMRSHREAAPYTDQTQSFDTPRAPTEDSEQYSDAEQGDELESEHSIHENEVRPDSLPPDQNKVAAINSLCEHCKDILLAHFLSNFPESLLESISERQI